MNSDLPAKKDSPVKSLPEAIRSSFMESLHWKSVELILYFAFATGAAVFFGAPFGVTIACYGAAMSSGALMTAGLVMLDTRDKIGSYKWCDTYEFNRHELSKEDRLKWEKRGAAAALALSLLGGAAGYSIITPPDTAGPPVDEPVATTPCLLEASAARLPELTAPAAVRRTENLGRFFQPVTAHRDYAQSPGKVFAVSAGSGPTLNGYASSTHLALA